MPQFADYSYVFIPPSKMPELLEIFNEDVDGRVLHHENVETPYTIGDDISVDAFHFDVVRRQLTRKVSLFTVPVYEELVLGFEDIWKADNNEWKAIKVFPTCMKIVARAANRVFTGDSLCRLLTST